ncbi:hypothetical protein INQ41_06900 [Lysobacter ciconiae]|uniref:Wadjet protein JetD C-terminal domain-containing protein n=1 Tax=Novilysobacter ciconiae TaxID=2781022 RepID=A0A7S6UDV8_9GAMM|nr:hypothetical protein INQ41_06900 [Lysobacter ciconiae]
MVFTGGMPSPAWVAGFRALTCELPRSMVFHHWGDIDVGGFRIAARLQEIAMPASVSLQPWLMDITLDGRGNEVKDSTRDAMRAAAIRAGWSTFDRLPALTLEQERVGVILPSLI